MFRVLFNHLIDWKNSPRRKPLILLGARQVGKTYLLNAFAAAEYTNFIYANFETEPHLKSLFQEDRRPERILQELSLYFKKDIQPGNTLLILDEIQECAEALVSLKYFCESKNDYHIVAAGSLLGVKLASSFPVGKVNFLHLYPMSFFEFLIAMNEESLVDYLKKLTETDTISSIFHERLLKWLKYYFVIGGMPEAVSAYKERSNLNEIRSVQAEILKTYTLDFAKHALPSDVMKIITIWEQLPLQLGKENKKFIFSVLSKSARAREYESALQWLISAGLVIKVKAITAPGIPLKAYAQTDAFKIYALDVGLLGAMSRLDPSILLEGHRLFEEFKGALTENFAAQMLNIGFSDNLYYWSSAGMAEVDFVIESQQKIYPLEVKSGLSKRKKSLQVFADKYFKEGKDIVLSRANPMPLQKTNNFTNYPLYLLEQFPL